jgi:hypothetical protein
MFDTSPALSAVQSMPGNIPDSNADTARFGKQSDQINTRVDSAGSANFGLSRLTAWRSSQFSGASQGATNLGSWINFNPGSNITPPPVAHGAQ